jgi:restriction system protein
MPIPDFQSLMLPLMEFLADGKEHTMRDATAVLADRYQLTEEEREQLMANGENKVFSNRVAWAKAHLKAAGLLDNPSRGKVRISEEGRSVLAQKPGKIDYGYLKQFPPYLTFIRQTKPEDATDKTPEKTVISEGLNEAPRELLESSYKALRKETAENLLSKLKACSPAFFEKVVVQLLRAMGYGGATGEGLVTGRPGDRGIDGVIKEDEPGLDVVCVQAKLWEGPVGGPEVRQFVGSMDQYRARKGVILTTS